MRSVSAPIKIKIVRMERMEGVKATQYCVFNLRLRQMSRAAAEK